jgi:uncharacterized protein
MNTPFRSALAIAIGMVLSSLVLSSTFLKAKKLDQTIQVTGSAQRRIKSDYMIWRASVTGEAAMLPEAYAKVSRDVEKTRKFLVTQGFPENEIITSAVVTTPVRTFNPGVERLRFPLNGADQEALTGHITGYNLKQSLEIRSSEIIKLTAASRSITQLVDQGILLESADPEYLYTKIAELKVAMPGEAARDARERAAQIVSSAGGKVGEMRSAEMGVMQINAAGEDTVSSYGTNDTKSEDKDVFAVVHATFALN